MPNRSDFIRSTTERVLTQDGEERQRVALLAHQFVSGSRKNGGWKPKTNHPENHQEGETYEYFTISDEQDDPDQAAAA